MECPKCGSVKVKRDGTDVHKKIRAQRYLCSTCGHLFRDYERTATLYKRVILIADPHCGHLTGLTPPNWENVNAGFSDFRREAWNWFSNVTELMKPFDFAIFNGDMIDGKQTKGGGLELLWNDRFKQVQMATEIAKKINAVKNIVIRGSKYHVGSEENFEDQFAENINAKIYDRFLGDIAGKVFDVRHKIGRSSIPHGRMTPLSRQVLWSRLREERSGVHADIIIRSHVHYSVYLEESGVIAFTTKALQGHSSYGAQECDGEVDFGLDILDIYNDGRILRHSFSPVFDSMKVKVEII